MMCPRKRVNSIFNLIDQPVALLEQFDFVAIAQLTVQFSARQAGLLKALAQELLQNGFDAAIQRIPLIQRCGQKFQMISDGRR